MTRDAPRTRIDLPLKGSTDRMVWLCVQPGTLDEATSRAKAAMQALETRGKIWAEQAANATIAAMDKANAEGGVPTELYDITRDIDAAFDRLSSEIDAEFGCLPQEIVKP